jgi:hypothetical protein
LHLRRDYLNLIVLLMIFLGAIYTASRLDADFGHVKMEEVKIVLQRANSSFVKELLDRLSLGSGGSFLRVSGLGGLGGFNSLGGLSRRVFFPTSAYLQALEQVCL